MIAYTPPLLFVLSWVFALLGMDAPGTGASTPFDEQALRWMLFLGMGWSILGGFLMHTVFARSTAKAIGRQTNGFQYEVGFASLGIGLAGIYASNLDLPEAWIAASLAGGLFLLLAGFNHMGSAGTERLCVCRNRGPGRNVAAARRHTLRPGPARTASTALATAPESVEAELLGEVAGMFGERSPDPHAFFLRHWGVDPLTEGYITAWRPGDVMAVGPLHGTHEPPFYVAGSDQWVCGYMEGAIRTGRGAAQAVLAQG